MHRPPIRRRRGFTLTELLVTIALAALVAGLAVPSFASAVARHRLQGAAEQLAHDLAEARFDAARRGTPLHVSFATGAQWCYAVAAAPDCGCRDAAGCGLKTVQAADHPGVQLLQAEDATLAPGPAGHRGGALLQGADGHQLRVALTPLGRPRVCAPAGAVRGYPGC
jgi:type IV fimbrial biogenesis protein FimT